jgi:Protein of unknown function (DUF3017)
VTFVPPRVVRRIQAQAPFLGVFAIIAMGFLFLFVAPGHWVRGTGVIALGMLVAAALRLVLHPTTAGLLAIRARWLDVAWYAGLGVLILLVDLRLRT